MQKVITITLNPAIDKSTSVKSMVPDKKLYCAKPKFEPGGGGVNVSRALLKMGEKSTAMYLAGGYSGKFFESLLNEEGVESLVIETKGLTRENMIVVDETNNLQYRFGMPGATILKEEIDNLFEVLQAAEGMEYIVASGSLPDGMDAGFFKKLAEIAKHKNAKLIVDTSGESLRQAINEGVFMIKPNLGELSMLNGVEDLQDDDIVKYARAIIDKKGAQVVVVSMGASGAVLITADEIINSSSPTVRKKSTVGAGDTMVAGMVKAMLQGWEWKDVLKYGIAAGTATTMNSGTELCKKVDVERLFTFLKKYG